MGMIREHRRYSKRVISTRRWQVLRHAILERDGWQCVQCGTRRGRLEVDHVQPVRTHPELSFNPGNLQCLCSSCHTRKTRIECGHKPAHDTPDSRAWANLVKSIEHKETDNA